MNKKLLFFIITIILIIGAALSYVLFTGTRDSADDNNNQTSQEPQATPPPEQPTTAEPPSRGGMYATYTSDAIASISGTKLLFFHAPWCPQCREIEADITTNGLPDDVAVIKVDYDSNQDLRQKYGVTIQTTFVKVDDKGEKIDSYVAYEEPRFSSVERELLRD